MNNERFGVSEVKRRREKFLPEEDKKLKELVDEYGDQAWDLVVKEMPGRNIRQCRERWKHYLSSNKGKQPWTPEEDQLLFDKMKEIGPKWTKLATYFNGRTDIQVKTRWMKKFAAVSNLHQHPKRKVTPTNPAPPESILPPLPPFLNTYPQPQPPQQKEVTFQPMDDVSYYCYDIPHSDSYNWWSSNPWLDQAV